MGNNRKVEREDRIIIIGNEERLKLIKNRPLIEFFIDITFKLIPKSFKPYKIMTLCSFDEEENKPILICLIFFKYMDSESYINIFNFLNQLYNFEPLIIHSDFEIALYKAINKINFVKNKILHLKCLFHFSNAISQKLKSLGLRKKKNFKINYEIINTVIHNAIRIEHL